MTTTEAATEAATEPAGREPDVAETGTRRRLLHRVLLWPAGLTVRMRRIVGVLAAVTIAGTGTLGYVWWAAASADADVAAGQSALASARRDVPQLLSYDYRTIDQAFPEAAKTLLTGKFLTEYTELGASVIQPAAKRDDIVTKAEVVEASVVSAKADAVTVLLFVNQTTTSKGMEGPRLDGSRVRVDLTKDGDSWKISEFVPV